MSSIVEERTVAGPDVAAQFSELLRQWKSRPRSPLGRVASKTQHPIYQAIIRLGEAAVPLLLAELQKEPDFWFEALRALTKENPVPNGSQGRLNDMTQAWLQWGRSKGHIT